MEPEYNFVGKIPVRNLWLLMLYASECRYLSEQLANSDDVAENVADLVGTVLCDLVESRLKRDLSRSFVRKTNELNRVRGRIKVLYSERSMSLSRGKIYCEFDELTLDSDRNRYIHAALYQLIKLVKPQSLVVRCSKLVQRFQQLSVTNQPSIGYKPSRERFGRHEVDDKKVLLMAELVFDMSLLNESFGNRLLPSPEKQEHWVRKLFEKAVGGFYELKLSKLGWRVKSSKKIWWQMGNSSTQMVSLMPSMELDILLENKLLRQRTIIDTKFTNIITVGRFGNETFKSNYIYQLYAYLMSQQKESDPLSLNSTGMLLHPSVGVEYDEFVVIQGHGLRFCTVDLSADANSISQRLLELVD